MKYLTSKHNAPLPLPGGRALAPGRTITVEDHVANMERVQGWVNGSAAELSDPPLHVVLQTSPAAVMEAVHRGGGSYSVMEGDREIVEGLSKNQAEKFNAMKPEEREEFLAKMGGQ